MALYHGGGEDGDDVTGELADVGGYPEQHPGRGEMVSHDIAQTILDLISPSPTMSAKRSIFACC